MGHGAAHHQGVEDECPRGGLTGVWHSPVLLRLSIPKAKVKLTGRSTEVF